jgi:hypothetical protein
MQDSAPLLTLGLRRVIMSYYVSLLVFFLGMLPCLRHRAIQPAKIPIRLGFMQMVASHEVFRRENQTESRTLIETPAMLKSPTGRKTATYLMQSSL